MEWIRLWKKDPPCLLAHRETTLHIFPATSLQIHYPSTHFSGALHWFVSQSIFLANINVYRVKGLSSDESVSTCGYSPIAMVFFIIFGSLLILFGLALGIRVYKPLITLAGSCSKKISAACHIPENELELHPEQGPLQWGVVPGVFDENGNPHCSLSSKRVLEQTCPQTSVRCI